MSQNVSIEDKLWKNRITYKRGDIRIIFEDSKKKKKKTKKKNNKKEKDSEGSSESGRRSAKVYLTIKNIITSFR